MSQNAKRLNMTSSNTSQIKSNKKGSEHDSSVASYTEIFLLKKLAPELLSPVGKASVIFVFFVWTMAAIYAVMNVEVEWNVKFYV